MVGYLGAAVAAALRQWPALKQANIFPTRAAEGTTVVVDTPLPAIVIHVIGTDDPEDEGGISFGGGIRFYFNLFMYVLLPVTNYSYSPDGGKQAELLDLSEDVVRCIEQTDVLDEVKRQHDLNLQFVNMPTDTTYGTRGAESVLVDVHKVSYKGSVSFDPKDKNKIEATLEKIIIKHENS